MASLKGRFGRERGPSNRGSARFGTPRGALIPPSSSLRNGEQFRSRVTWGALRAAHDEARGEVAVGAVHVREEAEGGAASGEPARRLGVEGGRLEAHGFFGRCFDELRDDVL